MWWYKTKSAICNFKKKIMTVEKFVADEEERVFRGGWTEISFFDVIFRLLTYFLVRFGVQALRWACRGSRTASWSSRETRWRWVLRETSTSSSWSSVTLIQRASTRARPAMSPATPAAPSMSSSQVRVTWSQVRITWSQVRITWTSGTVSHWVTSSSRTVNASSISIVSSNFFVANMQQLYKREAANALSLWKFCKSLNVMSPSCSCTVSEIFNVE